MQHLRALVASLVLALCAGTVVNAQPSLSHHAPGESFRDCADCPDMVVLPAGSFIMGSQASEPGRTSREGPQRPITIAHSFAVGKFEVTRAQYEAFVRATGYATSNNCVTDRSARGAWTPDPRGTWRDPGFPQSEDHPVVCVSWEDAQAYVRWLNARATGGYRLLTEAEYEYAARAGTTSPYPWGANADDGCAYANGADATAHANYPNAQATSCNDGALYTAAVGSYRPNGFGLYDMVGNTGEWVQDCYEATLDSVPRDGSAHEVKACSVRVVRGGSWLILPTGLRSAFRSPNSASSRGNGVGFRVARSV